MIYVDYITIWKGKELVKIKVDHFYKEKADIESMREILSQPTSVCFKYEELPDND